MNKCRQENGAPKGAFLTPAIELYRAERAKAVARGVNLTTPHPHPFIAFREADPKHRTWQPAVAIGDGCYLITPTK